MKEVKITPPEGYEVDKENSTFECIKFKHIKQLPTTWEKFCKSTPIKIGESWIDNHGQIMVNRTNEYPRLQEYKDILPSEDLTRAMRALCQLIQLRDCYNQGWQPDWNSDICDKWCIEIFKGQINKTSHTVIVRVLAFKSEKLRDEFLENFKYLIEIAKPLL